MKKLNCWEVKQCGHETGGIHSSRGVCPVSRESALDGVHGGSHAGRSCWVVPETCCDNVQGPFGDKQERCEQCDFYAAVKREEGGNFVLSVLLTHQLSKARGLVPKNRDAAAPCGVIWKGTPARRPGNTA